MDGRRRGLHGRPRKFLFAILCFILVLGLTHLLLTWTVLITIVRSGLIEDRERSVKQRLAVLSQRVVKLSLPSSWLGGIGGFMVGQLHAVQV
jgi:hypothetical protein